MLPRLTGPAAARLRARDELPQSAAGRTIMTTEPKFIPEAAVPRGSWRAAASFRVRLIDCVGYMVEGAMGHEENEKPRMVKSPWFEEEVPFDLAAETGTRKVITGPLHHRPRGHHRWLHQRDPPGKLPRGGGSGSSQELASAGQALCHPPQLRRPGRPGDPGSGGASWSRATAAACWPVSCLDLDAAASEHASCKRCCMSSRCGSWISRCPGWVTMLDKGHWLQTEVYSAAMAFSEPGDPDERPRCLRRGRAGL